MTPPFADAPDTASTHPARPAEPLRISIVVPCHNEADSLDRLAAGLARLQQALTPRYEMELILVDDGSTDATWQMMQDRFGGEEGAGLLQHPVNRGIAAAIQSGLMQAKTDIVASLDADCTYEPLQLLSLLDAFADDVDLVIASPYHPRGAVIGVPRWRLAISRLASRCYRLVMRNRLHTYTSCFRVYRRSAVADLKLAHEGFVGVAELVWQLDRRGGKIVECPAVLRTRTEGRSKMKIVRTAIGHLGLLLEAAGHRLLSFRSIGRWKRNEKSCFANRSTTRLSPRTT